MHIDMSVWLKTITIIVHKWIKRYYVIIILLFFIIIIIIIYGPQGNTINGLCV